MSRIIKTISLDKESDEIASKMGNFSKWVRNQLKAHAHTISFEHTNKELFLKQGICNPHNSPRCAICYPYGKPNDQNIIAFNSGRISKNKLKDLTRMQYDGVIEKGKPRIIEELPLDPPMSKQKERKYLRRALKYIWSFI